MTFPTLLFSCILSIFALIVLVFIALFCTDIRRDSFSLVRFLFPSHVQVFSCDISSVCHQKYPYIVVSLLISVTITFIFRSSKSRKVLVVVVFVDVVVVICIVVVV